MNSRFSRRALLRGAGVAGAVFGEVRSVAAAEPTSLVFVHLRGGADGLSLLVPYTDEHYYRARRSTAVAPPGSRTGAAVALDARYGLHPALGELAPLFAAGELGFVAGVGFPELVSSHVTARQALAAAVTAAFGAGPSVVLRGDASAAQLVASDLAREPSPRRFTIEHGDWDTHSAQGDGAGGRLADNARELASLLTMLHGALGSLRERVLVIVATEFGRSVTETPLAGTDDGHASLLVVMGGGQRFGNVYGAWPSLAPEARSGGRHVAVSTDVRAVFARLARGEAPV